MGEGRDLRRSVAGGLPCAKPRLVVVHVLDQVPDLLFRHQGAVPGHDVNPAIEDGEPGFTGPIGPEFDEVRRRVVRSAIVLRGVDAVLGCDVRRGGTVSQAAVAVADRAVHTVQLAGHRRVVGPRSLGGP